MRFASFCLGAFAIALPMVFLAAITMHAQTNADAQDNRSEYMYPVLIRTQQGPRRAATSDDSRREKNANVNTNRKLQRIILPRVEFRSTRLADAIEYLHQESVRLDSVSAPSERGVDIFVPPPSVVKRYRDDDPYAEVQAEAPIILRSPDLDRTLTLSLTRIPLVEAIRYLARAVNRNVRVDRDAVYLESCNVDNQPTDVREYCLPQKFALLKYLSQNSIRDILEAQGIEYPNSANAVYRFEQNRLVVRNTPENLDLISFLFTEASVPVTPALLANP